MRFLILLMFAFAMIGCVDERGSDRADSEDVSEGSDIAESCDTSGQAEGLAPRIDKYNKDLEDGDYPHLCAHWRKGESYDGGWCWWSAEPIEEDVCVLVPRCVLVPEDDIEQVRADKCN